MAGQGLNTTLTAAGVGQFSLRTMRISYALNIIATEDQSATYKYLYTRQVQTDTFALQVLFDSLAERDSFFTWYQQYARLAIVPSPVGSIRVQIPSRNFDMTGTLVAGPQQITTPADVTWNATLQFNGAYFTNQMDNPLASKFVAPSNQTASRFFYPNSTDLGAKVTQTSGNAAAQAQAVQNAITATKNLENAIVVGDEHKGAF